MTFLAILVALTCLVAFAGAVGRRRFESQIDESVDELLGRAGEGIVPERVVDRIRELPDPVRRYLAYSLGPNPRPVRTMHMRHRGAFRMSAKLPWVRIEGEQYFTVSEPGFVWKGLIHLVPFVWVEACDRLLGGRGSMPVKVCGLAPLANATGREMDQGSRWRWLGEMIWCPLAFVGDRVRWDPIDARSARVTLECDGLPVSAIAEFDEQGKLVCMRGERYREDQGKYVKTPYRAICGSYRSLAGVRMPTAVEVAWELPAGTLAYGRWRIVAVEYDVTKAPHVAKHPSEPHVGLAARA